MNQQRQLSWYSSYSRYIWLLMHTLLKWSPPRTIAYSTKPHCSIKEHCTARARFCEVKRVVLPLMETKVRYQQTHFGLPVFNTSVVATLSKNQPPKYLVQWRKGSAMIHHTSRLNWTGASHRSCIVLPPPVYQSAKSRLKTKMRRGCQAHYVQTAQVVYLVDFLSRPITQNVLLSLLMLRRGSIKMERIESRQSL